MSRPIETRPRQSLIVKAGHTIPGRLGNLLKPGMVITVVQRQVATVQIKIPNSPDTQAIKVVDVNDANFTVGR